MAARASAHQSCCQPAEAASRAASTGYEGSTIDFGSRRQSRSISDSAIPTAAKYRYAGSALSRCSRSSRTARAANTTAVANSTSGYRRLIGASQSAHLPRSSSQPNTGTLCRLRIGRPQEGQRDAGRTSDPPRGTRYTTTFRNEPTASPSSVTSGSSAASGSGAAIGSPFGGREGRERCGGGGRGLRPRTANREPLGVEQRAQHVLHDPAVPVVVGLAGGVDAHHRVELDLA